jgi:hypothetical protein
MSRDVEVLRDSGGMALIRFSPTRAYRLYLDGTATGEQLKADMDLISTAMSALKEKEACPLCHQPPAWHPGGVYCPMPAKSSSSDKERLSPTPRWDEPIPVPFLPTPDRDRGIW